jgi:hypothetical protein
MRKHLTFAYTALIVGCTAPFASRAPAEPDDPAGLPTRPDEAPLDPDGGRGTSDAAVRATPNDPGVDGGDAPPDGGTPPSSDGDAGPGPGPGPSTTLRDVYRAFNPTIGDHLQGLVANEGAPDWTPEGVGFRIYADVAAARAALYRCRVNDTSYHFLSTAGDCEGQTVEGPLGYLSTNASDGVALYRCVLGGDHLSTLDPSECQAAGFVVEGQQGFAFR